MNNNLVSPINRFLNNRDCTTFDYGQELIDKCIEVIDEWEQEYYGELYNSCNNINELLIEIFKSYMNYFELLQVNIEYPEDIPKNSFKISCVMNEIIRDVKRIRELEK